MSRSMVGSTLRVLKVVDGEYPWDVRVEKVSRAITDLGHDVHMVARNRDGRVLKERLEEANMHRMRPWSWLGSSLDAASQFPAFLNPRWFMLILQTGREVSADLILVRDLPLAPTAIWVGRRLGIPVVLDMAENYPAMIRDLWTTDATKLGDALVRNPKAVEAVERWVMKRIDHTLVVVEESRDRLLAMGVPECAITVVSNTPSLTRVDEFERIRAEHHAQRSEDRDGLRLVYLGLMEEARGVRLVLDALSEVRDRGVAVSLDLIGDGRALNSFKKHVGILGLTDCVRFHGFLPYADALALVAEADAGLIPHYANESWETTIPNKLFDYMSLGLPVVASDVSPVKRVLDETRAGVTFRDRSASDLSRALRDLALGTDRTGFGRAGVAAVRERYNWERDTERLDLALGQVVEKSRSEVGEQHLGT